ncbi:MAG: alpha/beta fold hydrolase [Candidatus Lokiarchaeota archaeon]|nr:alpha/beta fold hydrolase [Candidatus Lokiarchaeota archaeon]
MKKKTILSKFEKLKKIHEIHIDIDELYHKYRKKLFVVSFLFLITSVSLLYFFRTESYKGYERISFECAGSTLYANLYYPTYGVDFQNKKPLVIYAHGIGNRRDIDIRAPLELTKRGFFVVTIDYQAHGESQGQIFDIDEETDIPALALVCTNCLDKLEQMDVYKERINPKQIGLLGHSLGGLVVLLNSALDDRFNTTVTWAGLVDFELDELDLPREKKEKIRKYRPSEVVDENTPKNLLAIQHIDDEILPYEDNALYLRELTGCELVTIYEPLLGGAHNLYCEKVMIETIQFFEKIFFGSKYKNGEINLTYDLNFVLIYISFIALFFTTLSIMLYFSKYFSIKIDYRFISEATPKEIEKSEKKSQRKKIFKYILAFVSVWGLSVLFFGILGLLVAPIIIILFYAIFKLKAYYNLKPEERDFSIKETLKYQFDKNAIAYSVFCTFVFLTAYMIYTGTYPFAFFIPSSIITFVLAFSVYPWYFAFELFYRKIIYPELYYVKSPLMRIGIVTFLALITQIILLVLALPYSVVQPVFATFIVSLAVIIINSVVYEKTKRFGVGILSSFIIIQIFFGAALQTALSVNSVIHIMLGN